MVPASVDSARAIDSAVTVSAAQCSASESVAAVRTIWLIRYAVIMSHMVARTSIAASVGGGCGSAGRLCHVILSWERAAVRWNGW